MNALLCVALLVPGYGEKDILERIKAAGGWVNKNLYFTGELTVSFPDTTTDGDLGELCELRAVYDLRLAEARISDKGLRTVSELRELHHLDLCSTGVTDEGLRHLKLLSNLEELDLRDCPDITAEGVARLKKALPNCKIIR